MDKRSQISRLIMLTEAQLKSLHHHIGDLNNPLRALTALSTAIDLELKIWEILDSEDKRLKSFLNVLADEQSFKKDE